MKRKPYSPAFVLSLCSLMTALGTVVMLSSGLIPILTYTSPLIASFMLIPVIYEFGRKQAWMTWGVTSMLSLLICSDREAAFFYLFLGYYPILKNILNRFTLKTTRTVAKLAVFTLGILSLFLILTFVLGLEDMRDELLINAVIYLMLIAVMMIFDRALDYMLLFYERRLRKRLIRKG